MCSMAVGRDRRAMLLLNAADDDQSTVCHGDSDGKYSRAECGHCGARR